MDNWKNNRIQFPRFIEEARAAGAFTPEVLEAMATSMNLEVKDLYEILDRAEVEWDSIVSKL